MAQTYPRIKAPLTDARETLLVTAWLQRSSSGVANFLLRQAPVVSLNEALKLISQFASQQGVPSKHVDIDLSLQTMLVPTSQAKCVVG
jgi:hypothetical protein